MDNKFCFCRSQEGRKPHGWGLSLSTLSQRSQEARTRRLATQAPLWVSRSGAEIKGKGRTWVSMGMYRLLSACPDRDTEICLHKGAGSSVAADEYQPTQEMSTIRLFPGQLLLPLGNLLSQWGQMKLHLASKTLCALQVKTCVCMLHLITSICFIGLYCSFSVKSCWFLPSNLTLLGKVWKPGFPKHSSPQIRLLNK